MKRPRWRFWIILAVLPIFLPGTAHAKAVFLNTPLFGNLNQQNSIIRNMWESYACNVTSMVNAMVYLQRNYPGIYGNNLVAGYDATTMANTAVTLGGSNYMNVQLYNGSFGVDCRDYLWGPYLYMQAQDPNMAPQTYWGATSGPNWLQPWHWTTDRPSPAWATIGNLAPSADDLYNALSASLATLILWRGITIAPDGSISLNGKGHYMTVTGLIWDPDSKTGTLYYIDPQGGKPHNSPMWIIPGGLLCIDYGETDGVPWQGTSGPWWYSGPAEIVFAMAFGPLGVAPVQPARHGALPPYILLILMD